ncbi:NEAT domain-containing protein [Ornithinibacillus halotolerans]|uniref:NEAT domain-containing protein n=1 Tax=Ornithinibacillus halotolerans TaxID=1274357 RepID=A0A916RZT1_9BACI|nr:NEAT domain-containing protein [Ornithinibacillus halotolerans]GGA74397.1 hypothetical protein GCM10008025_17670 [Ornithinibacillus halotolerans]
MKQRFSFLAIITVLFFSITSIVLPKDVALAKIADGRYELNYEMKEAYSENTSIADGYFTKPAILTVQNGVQYIQMTVTGSNYVQSLSAPSGPVEIVSEDKTNFVRTVKFRVDGDLSKPLDMEMHIVVPDLYDMTHTARAVFDLSPVKAASAPAQKAEEKKASNKKESSQSTNQPVEKKEKEEKNTTVANTDKNKGNDKPEDTVKEEEKKEEQTETEEADKAEEIDEEDNEENAEDANSEEEEDLTSKEASDTQVEDTQKEDNSSNAGFIVLLIVGVIIVVVAILLIRKKRSN